MRQRLEFTQQELQGIITAHINECSLQDVEPADVRFGQNEDGEYTAIVDTKD